MTDVPYCPTCRSSSSGRCAEHRDPVVFRDRYFLTIDIDPATEANLRADERNRTLDEVRDLIRDMLGAAGDRLLVALARLRK